MKKILLIGKVTSFPAIIKVKNNIINRFRNLQINYPAAQFSVGIIEGVYEMSSPDENIYQLCGDALLELLMPYKHPTQHLNMLLSDELSYWDSIFSYSFICSSISSLCLNNTS